MWEDDLRVKYAEEKRTVVRHKRCNYRKFIHLIRVVVKALDTYISLDERNLL